MYLLDATGPHFILVQFSFETGEIDYMAHPHGTEPQKWTTEVRDVASSLTEGQSVHLLVVFIL